MNKKNQDNLIAITGISVRLPGAQNTKELWDNLINGKNCIERFDKSKLNRKEINPNLLNRDEFVPALGTIKDIDKFDADFFGYNPFEVNVMDPQGRLFLECVHEALEDGGYVPDNFNGRIGVFAGAGPSHYMMNNLNHLIQKEKISNDPFKYTYPNSADFLSTNVSYKLNLNGPSMSVRNWCTSSSSAIHYAIQSLLSGDCNLAIAGGAQIIIPQYGYIAEEGGFDSVNGEIKFCDIDSNGTVPGNGVSVITLRKLEDSLADNDNFYAVIRSSSLINEGKPNNRLSYFGLTVKGQHNAMNIALDKADIDPGSVDYIELHGSCNIIGDRLEVEALNKFYNNKEFYIGSIKPNIGNLGPATGITALIKTALAVKHGKIPPSIGVNNINNKIKDINKLYKINLDVVDWLNTKGPRRAAVNSFGIGGTYCHFIVEEAPKFDIYENKVRRENSIIINTAKTNYSLERIQEKTDDFIKENHNVPIEDIAYTLAIGRKHYNSKSFKIFDKNNNLIISGAKLLSQSNQVKRKGSRFDTGIRIPDLSVDILNTGFDLYHSEPGFKSVFGSYSQVIYEQTGIDPVSIIIDIDRKNSDLFTESDHKILLLYLCTSISIIDTMKNWNIKPNFYLGYGLGNLIALKLSNSLSFIQVLKIFEVLNFKQKSAVSDLKSKIPGILLSLDPVLIHQHIKNISVSSFEIPIFSITNGKQILEEDIKSESFWNEIKLSGLKLMENWQPDAYKSPVLIDLNNGFSLIYQNSEEVANNSPEINPHVNLLNLLGKLWLKGTDIAWNNFYNGLNCHKISLPTYQFDKKSFWISPENEQAQSQEENVISDEQVSGSVETTILSWIEDLLGIKEIKVTENFEKIGGNSIVGVMLISKINRRFKTNIKVHNIYSSKTIGDFIALVIKQINHGSSGKSIDLESFTRLNAHEQIAFLIKYIEDTIYNIVGYVEYDSLNEHIKNLIPDLSLEIKNDFNVTIVTQEYNKINCVNDLALTIQKELQKNSYDTPVSNTNKFSTFSWIPNINIDEVQIQNKIKNVAFIVSAPRSGSTLLSLILNGHNNLFCPPEIGLASFTDMATWKSNYKNAGTNQEGLIQTLQLVKKSGRAEAENYINLLANKSVATCEVYKELLKNIDGKMLIDKSPDYSYKLESLLYINKIFEKPRFIFLVRHPYSVIESFVRCGLDKIVGIEDNNPFHQAEHVWQTSNTNIIRFSQRINNEQFIFIRYEDLVSDSEKTIKEICAFLGVKYYESLNYPYNNKSVISYTGDQNIYSHDEIEAKLGEKWKTINLPIQLGSKTILLNNEFNYDLHNERITSNSFCN